MTDQFATNGTDGSAGLAHLSEVVDRAGARGPAPVEHWNPPYCGEIGLSIARDGTWFYQGTAIERRPLMRLFASVLRKDEDGRHYLVTPVEKIGIDVADAPFLAVEMALGNPGRHQSLTFRTNMDDLVTVDEAHPMRFETERGSGGLKPYARVRGRLEAVLSRALAYDLIALGCVEGDALGIWSGGRFFAMAPASLAGAD